MIAISNVDEKLNNFLTKHWIVFWFDIEIIELIWKNNRFVNDVNRFFERFSNEKNVSNIDDQKSDFWFNDEITDSIIAQIFDIMFSWWSKFDFLNFKHECFVRSDKANLDSRLKKKNYSWIKIIA